LREYVNNTKYTWKLLSLPFVIFWV